MMSISGKKYRGRSTFRPVSSWRIGAVSFLFFALFCQLSVRISVMRTAFEIENIRQSALASDLQLRQLDLQYASLSRPADIRKRANENLQLVPIEKDAVRHVSYLNSHKDAGRRLQTRDNPRSRI